MHSLTAGQVLTVRCGAGLRLQTAPMLQRVGVAHVLKAGNGSCARSARAENLRKATLCSSTSIGTRSIPEGMLSHDEDVDAGRSSQVETRSIPEGLLSHDDNGVVATCAASADLRVVPEGMLSREDASYVKSSSPPACSDVPEGMLSREEVSDTETDTDSERRRFDWFQQWYPVASLDALDATRPHPFTLLGQPLVLWRDGSGLWRAFKDACPHRLAPLSEGRVEKDGTLLCAYHGWRFDGSGGCTALPFCRPDDPALRSPRSCAVSHPTLERGGLLWVWAQGGPGAAATAATKQPPVPPEVQDDGSPRPGVTCLGWSHRDVPYGHTFFVENVVDPAHVPVSHHNIAGNRYKDPRPFEIEITRPLSLEGGFVMSLANMESAVIQSSFTEFVPPGLVRIQANNRDGSRTILALFSTPIRPGWTRLVGQQIMIASPDNAARGSSVVGFVGAAVPQWLSHLLAPFFLHQDMVFLHYQERAVMRLQQQHGKEKAAVAGNAGDGSEEDPNLPMPKFYYTPGTADKGVAAWRMWLMKFAGGDVSYAPGTPPLHSSPDLDRSALFDTWNTHTRHCTICLTALKRLQLVRAVATAVGLAAAGLAFGGVVAKAATAAASTTAASTAAEVAASSAASYASVAAAVLQAVGCWLFASWEGLALMAMAAVAAGVMLITTKMEQMMHKYEFSHADNH